ncbi:MAG: type II toxin-antitoxin system VapC family toxin [Spirochaetaceae bacterium]|nr:type II toxin-antitoxin system VapC family toxin [Spirochaetaceae bacterium]MCF7949858.1 type II toxin-antitoxin system VapC family toxin [Spirochaetia bacterium]MCF7952082.1 type II toxin-antitoxin system VapC family toxin [Spirochaetaceae bacterium]
MRLLLDTHAFLWWMDDSDLLDEHLRVEIANPNNDVYLSAVVIWEITIKTGLGKLSIPKNWYEKAYQEPFNQLSITHDHAYQVGTLPDIHRDPFDRFLIAQAQVEGLTLITKDTIIPKYNVSIL